MGNPQSMLKFKWSLKLISGDAINSHSKNKIEGDE